MPGSVADFLKNAKLLYGATTSPADYDFMNKVVQFDDDPNNVASGEATILFSGPPVTPQSMGSTALLNGKSLEQCLVPIGAVQGFQDNEQPNIQPFPELGSRLKRMAVGMSTYSVSISKVLTYHSNLRNALYAWIDKLGVVNGVGDPLDYLFKPGETDAPGRAHLTTSESDLNRIPFGLLLITVSAGGYRISREYYEKCYIQNVGKAVQAGSSIIQENVQIYVTRKVPLDEIDLPGLATRKSFDIVQGNVQANPAAVENLN